MQRRFPLSSPNKANPLFLRKTLRKTHINSILNNVWEMGGGGGPNVVSSSGVVPANQTRKGRFASRFTKIGSFLNSGPFPGKTRTSQKSVPFVLWLFSLQILSSCFRRENTPNSEKYTIFANQLANGPFFWLAGTTPNLQDCQPLWKMKTCPAKSFREPQPYSHFRLKDVLVLHKVARTSLLLLVFFRQSGTTTESREGYGRYAFRMAPLWNELALRKSL